MTKAQARSPNRWVRHGNDGAFGHVRMAIDQVLDLGDGNVLAAADDDVLAAPDDADVAIAVHAREIAGVEPAVLVDRN